MSDWKIYCPVCGFALDLEDCEDILLHFLLAFAVDKHGIFSQHKCHSNLMIGKPKKEKAS